MAVKFVHILPPASALVFSLIAFIFALVAITSNDWAVRDNFNATLPSPANWTHPIFTLHRSPFRICSAVPYTPTTNDTSAANSTSPGSSNSTTGGSDGSNSSTDPTQGSGSTPITTTNLWNVTCQSYRPFGFDRTSCELEIATLRDPAPNLGDARLCQQIHYAGNFGIAGTLFISLGFLATALLALATLSASFSGRGSDVTQDEPGVHRETVVASESAKQVGDGSNDGEEQKSASHRHRHDRRKGRARRTTAVSYVTLAALTFWGVGIATALISQFYAIEGLIQSAPNNADFASSTATSGDNVNTKGLHGPWYQGSALSVYWTCAWAFALLAGCVAARTWQLPRWEADV